MKKEPPQEENWEANLELDPGLEPEARELLVELYRDHADMYAEFADEWYYTETEARVGASREQALARLRAFVQKIRSAPRAESE